MPGAHGGERYSRRNRWKGFPDALVAILVREIFAAGTAAPVASLTCPVTSPNVWRKADTEKNEPSNPQSRKDAERLVVIELPRLNLLVSGTVGLNAYLSRLGKKRRGRDSLAGLGIRYHQLSGLD